MCSGWNCLPVRISATGPAIATIRWLRNMEVVWMEMRISIPPTVKTMWQIWFSIFRRLSRRDINFLHYWDIRIRCRMMTERMHVLWDLCLMRWCIINYRQVKRVRWSVLIKINTCWLLILVVPNTLSKISICLLLLPVSMVATVLERTTVMLSFLREHLRGEWIRKIFWKMSTGSPMPSCVSAWDK